MTSNVDDAGRAAAVTSPVGSALWSCEGAPLTPTYRFLSCASDFAAVVDLERGICGPLYDAVPMSLFVVMAQRGGILVGAFDDVGLLIGCVCSLSTVTAGRVGQWSYRMGVRREQRGAGIATRLKHLQRERALEMGIDLIEWTFDPLLAANAQFNIAALGAVAHQYLANCEYCEALAPAVHRRVPSDQLVARWHLRDARVARLAADVAAADQRTSRDFDGAAPVNCVRRDGDRLVCREFTLDADEERLIVEVPAAFGEMVANAPDAALAWRVATRQIFSAYFARGYHVARFRQDRSKGTGTYLLVENPDRLC